MSRPPIPPAMPPAVPPAERLPIALRAHIEPTTPKRKTSRQTSRRSAEGATSHAHQQDQEPTPTTTPTREPWPASVLVFDTETTTDRSQRLTFGAFRYYRCPPGGLPRCVCEGLLYADDLPTRDPDGWAVLQDYARTQPADVAPGEYPVLRLLTRQEFADAILWPAIEARALLVGFNLPFDLSRLAVHASEARGTNYGGFSLRIWDRTGPRGRTHEHPFRPRVIVKAIDSKRAFIGLSKPHGPEGKRWGKYRGYFLDLKTLAFALTSQAHSLASACVAFGVEHGKTQAEAHGRISPAYVEYCRNDVRATAELLGKLREEFDRHPIALEPWRALSPASIGKAYLRAMGIRPPLGKFGAQAPEATRIGLLSYFGGRAECHIRRAPVPVMLVDFLSMYPTVNALMQLWRMLMADSLELVDATDDVRALLAGVQAGACYDPAFWAGLTFFAEIEPHADVLPVRAPYAAHSPAFNIGANFLTSALPLWYAGPDLVASALLTGKPPRVRRAVRLVAHGQQAGLQAVALGSRIPVDPACVDFFRVVIEERARVKRSTVQGGEAAWLSQQLKILANSTSYGIFCELTPEDLPSGETRPVHVHGLHGAFSARTTAPEYPGAHFCPPLASLITAGARLMLALVEHSVREQGGTYAFCDTDSLAIVAGPCAGWRECPGAEADPADRLERVRVLSWEQVRDLVERFAHLNPYARDAVPGSVLKIEDVNTDAEGRPRALETFAISAKRYPLFTRDPSGGIHVHKYSEHGLGHLLNPTDPDSADRDWIRQLWAYLVARELDMPASEPAWLDRPALSRVSVSTPTLWERFRPAKGRRAYTESVKPFGFALSAHVAPLGHPAGVDPTHFHLLAPYERDARKWDRLDWRDLYSGTRYILTTQTPEVAGVVRVRSYRDVLGLYLMHPESKSAGADGRACARDTVGLLARRHVRADAAMCVYIGKEANAVEHVDAGLVHAQSDVLGVFTDERAEWEHVLRPYLLSIPRGEAARVLDISERAVSALRSGQVHPSSRVRLKIELLHRRSARAMSTS